MDVRLPVLRVAYLCVSRCRSSTTAVTSVLVTATRPASSSSGRRVGPDLVLPSNTLTCTVPGGAAEIRTDHDHPVVKLPAISVWTMLQLKGVPGRNQGRPSKDIAAQIKNINEKSN